MKVTVQLVIESENGSTKKVSSVGEWQRNEPLQPSNLGLIWPAILILKRKDNKVLCYN